MAATSTHVRFAIAWSLALAPVFLFLPALMLAGIGFCGISQPLVAAVGFLLDEARFR